MARRRQTGPKPKRQGPDTHAGLDRRFAEIGRRLTLLSTDGSLPVVPARAGYRQARMDALLDALKDRQFVGSKGAYRQVHPGQDEHFSTASWTSMARGIYTHLAPSSPNGPALRKALDLLSRLRFPTAWTGFDTSDGRMQHPTAPEMHIFGKPAGSGSEHSRQDRLRRTEIAAAMETALDASGATIDNVTRAGAATAISSTLGRLLSPAAAQGNAARASPFDIHRQTLDREWAKHVWHQLMPDQPQLEQPVDARWGLAVHTRAVSPFRRAGRSSSVDSNSSRSRSSSSKPGGTRPGGRMSVDGSSSPRGAAGLVPVSP